MDRPAGHLVKKYDSILTELLPVEEPLLDPSDVVFYTPFAGRQRGVLPLRSAIDGLSTMMQRLDTSPATT